MITTRDSPPAINPVIDDQHAVLIAHIDRLEQALTAGQDAAILTPIVREVAEQARYHCPVEERLMESHRYPLRDLHAMEHQKFFERLGEIDRTIAEGHTTAAAQTLNRLRGWLDRHMVEWDAKLADFLNSRGPT
jgi:hemerythrin